MQRQTLDLLAARRSVGAKMLREPGPGREELELMLTIASRVPDHGKLEPWRFIVLAGEARERIGDVIAAAAQADDPAIDAEKLEQQRGMLMRAPVVVTVVSRAAAHPKIPEWEQILSAGAVCQNLLTAAVASGFAANWITEWIAFDRRVLEALGLGADERVAGFVHIGSADFTPPDRPRPSLDKVVTWL